METMKAAPSRLLPTPRVEVWRENGRVVGVAVRLRTGKARYSIERDRAVLVSIAVDPRGLPVVLHLEDWKDPLAMLRDVLDQVLLATEADPVERRRYSSPEYVARLHRALRRAFRHLPRRPAPASAG